MNDTPLMKQYKEIKSKYKDEILFFRLGDFYEMFFDDAIIASKVLDITLTARNREKNETIPMAGIPFHSAQSYINKLVSNGYKVAICEQTEEASSTKGLVNREVVQIITAGTTIDIDNIDSKSNNYLLAIHGDMKRVVASYVDITTSEFNVRNIDILSINTLIYKLDVKEVIITKDIYDKIKHIFSEDLSIKIVNKVKNSDQFLKDFFNVYNLDVFNLSDNLMIDCASIIIDYLLEVKFNTELNIKKINVESDNDYTYLNINTLRNLDVLKNQKDGKKYGSLLWVLDNCKTSMGARLLKKYINNPLIDIEKINKRLDDVEYLNKEFILTEELLEVLNDIFDIERLTSKIVFRNINGKDLISLKNSLNCIFKLNNLWKEKFEEFDFDEITEVYNIINNSISDDAPFSIREGNIIKRGYNEDLDSYHVLLNDSAKYLMDLEIKEKERTGIKNLKIKYNKVFGYFIELSRVNNVTLPDDYIIKQTLANNIRYITDDLKNFEYKVLNAKDKVNELEYQLFMDIVDKLKDKVNLINKLANKVAYIDVCCSLSKVAVENNYIRPIFNNDYEIDIKGGRHPIIEKLISDRFTPNDILLTKEESFMILTGPNMAGKSTYMKQTALIVLMAQIGSFVPAKSANLSIVDKILTRIGASDDILSGQSTFMVEMVEVSNIINNATEKSLIILDEVGRGTSTTDGLSIAIAITNYLNTYIKAKTIFATHYHELTDISNNQKNIVNYNVDVYENDNKIVFTHNIVKGTSKKSYGIEVAKLAGLPRKILKDSNNILKNLEKKEKYDEYNLFNYLSNDDNKDDEIDLEIERKLNKLKEIEEYLNNIDIYNTTPMKSLEILENLKKEFK